MKYSNTSKSLSKLIVKNEPTLSITRCVTKHLSGSRADCIWSPDQACKKAFSVTVASLMLKPVVMWLSLIGY